MDRHLCATAPTLRVLDLGAFSRLRFPRREMVMDPALPMQGLAMVYAPRGLGKTFFALGLAHAVAGGGAFLRWHAPTPRRVLYIDGEMPAVVMQDRLRLIGETATYAIAELENLLFINADLQGDTRLDISSVQGQTVINAHLADVDLVVLDNLASLHLSGAENEGDSWLGVQQWLLQLRRSGRSVLLVHHSGKAGQQRGTSRREDVLDTVIALRRPSDYRADQGARFEVHFEKARGIYGNDTLPFEAQLITTGHGVKWVTKPLEDVNRAKVVAMARQGLSVREIAEETNLSKSVVGRIRKAAQEAGELDDAED
jgi:putative DNA primase/helicase